MTKDIVSFHIPEYDPLRGSFHISIEAFFAKLNELLCSGVSYTLVLGNSPLLKKHLPLLTVLERSFSPDRVEDATVTIFVSDIENGSIHYVIDS